MKHFPEEIFESKITDFNELSLSVFRYQYHNNPTYREFCNRMGCPDPLAVKDIQQIPFLPAELFKTHPVRSFSGDPEKIFYSSSTTHTGQSAHEVYQLSVYEKSLLQGFEDFFGPIENACFLGLLPSYLEREGSSLVYMVQYLMKVSNHPMNGFFLYEHEPLLERILHLERSGQPYYLFGVSFGLLDFAAKYNAEIHSGKIIETGGMKGRKKEITKFELHDILSRAFQTKEIYSEYGMTELLSQAYARMDEPYQSPPRMKVMVADPNDPKDWLPSGRTGRICVIDLANYYSCSFIQTSDLGKSFSDGRFEVLGRMDNSDLRGCSLMAV